jgi:uncharacterized protein (TIGR02265 family)
VRLVPSTWGEPPWDDPLDPGPLIEAIPAAATITGAFLQAIVDAARARERPLASRGSYVGFRRYPLREHARLLVEGARALFPGESLRMGLRRLGRGGPRTLIGTMLGRVVLGSVEGPVETLRAMAKAYPLHTTPGSLEIVEAAPGRAVVHVEEIHYFLDSHHVGVFEGVMRLAGVEAARVQISPISRTSADLLCTWRG